MTKHLNQDEKDAQRLREAQESDAKENEQKVVDPDAEERKRQAEQFNR